MSHEAPMVELLVERLLEKQHALLQLIERGDQVSDERLGQAVSELEQVFGAVQLALPEPPTDDVLRAELLRAQRLASFLVHRLAGRRAELEERARLAERAREALSGRTPSPTGQSCDLAG